MEHKFFHGLTSQHIIFITIVVCSLLILSCEQPNDSTSNNDDLSPLPAFTVSWNEQNTIVCFGTSLTYGYGAGGKRSGGLGFTDTTGRWLLVGDSSYPRFLNEALRIKVINQGYVGAKVSYALTILNDSVLSKKPALVLLEFGANDYLQRIGSNVTDSLLTKLIQNITQYGSKVVLISFINPEMTKYMSSGGWLPQDSIRALEYYSMLNNLSLRLSVPLVKYPLKDIFGIPSMMSDKLHPNGVGYLKMQQNITYALGKTFKENNMIN